MANLKSSKKDIRRTARRTERNDARRSTIDILSRQLKKAVAKKDKKELKELLPKFYKAIDKAASRKVIEKNTAARKKSAAAKLLSE